MASNVQALTPKQATFLVEYRKDRNATQAAIRAGYSAHSARQTGSRLLALEAVQVALRAKRSEALASLEVTEDRLLQELAAIAFSNIRTYCRWTEDGQLEVIASEDIPGELAAAIESVEEQTFTTSNKDGSKDYTRVKRKVKLYSKMDALKLLAEYMGLSNELAPKVLVYLKTGIDRSPDPPAAGKPVIDLPSE
jgi:phage terminase small subunit